MLELRIRACHVHGSFVCKDNRAPEISRRSPLEQPRGDFARFCLPPWTYSQERNKIDTRWPAAVDYIARHKLNEVMPGAPSRIGVIVQGGMYNGLLRSLQRLALADAFGKSDIPIYVLNVTYPLVPQEVVDFCQNKDAVLIMEEGQPNYLEQAVRAILQERNVTSTAIHGKDCLPQAGEYTGEV